MKGPEGILRRVRNDASLPDLTGDQYLDQNNDIWVYYNNCRICSSRVYAKVMSTTRSWGKTSSGMAKESTAEAPHKEICHVCIPIMEKVRRIRKLTLVE